MRSVLRKSVLVTRISALTTKRRPHEKESGARKGKKEKGSTKRRTRHPRNSNLRRPMSPLVKKEKERTQRSVRPSEFIQSQAACRKPKASKRLRYHWALFLHHHAADLESYETTRVHQDRLAHLKIACKRRPRFRATDARASGSDGEADVKPSMLEWVDAACATALWA
jgi:hypothetical protein